MSARSWKLIAGPANAQIEIRCHYYRGDDASLQPFRVMRDALQKLPGYENARIIDTSERDTVMG